MQSPKPYSNSFSHSCEPVEIRVQSPQRWPRPKCESVYLLISSRIYWKGANKDAVGKPPTFLDFRNADSLELVRLDNGTWDDVEEYVKVDNHHGRACITLHGHLHGRIRRNNALLVPNVRVDIIPCTSQQLEVWVNQIRARIAPWSLLQQEINDIARRAPLSGMEEFEKALSGLFNSRAVTKPSLMQTDEGRETTSNSLGTLTGQIGKLPIVDELLVYGTTAVETGAALSKLVASVENVGKAAELVADISKCVAGVGSVFHLLALSAQGLAMCAEAKRGRRVLPVALGRIVILLRYVLESMAAIMRTARNVNELDRQFIFQVLKQTVGAMDMAETQLLRGRGSEFMNAEDVKEVERKIEELEPLVVMANNISRTCRVDEKVNQLEEEREMADSGPHHVRPSISAFFSGRARELGELRDILDKWGSAVITQYGGVGKTELMIALANRAEREEAVPGGVFWVTVDGSERDLIASLANLTEKLKRRKMSEEERQNGNLVLTMLKQGLNERAGRWLLCLDNADDSRVSGILNEVCGIAQEARGKGWVLVTSRQGQPHIWSEMTGEQKLVLGPLCTEDAMVALWRQIRKIKADVQDDHCVINAIKGLARDDPDEYRALKELCEEEGGCSLGGLPLALVQAGTYMAQFKCSIAEYLHMFMNANRIEDMRNIMKNTEEMKPIRESQRSIWTTWKMSVARLSGKAYRVLRAMAMLSPVGVGQAIVEGVVKRFAGDEGGSIELMFRNVVIKELIHGSSLIFQDEGERYGREGSRYRMHGLVRRFILSDMKRGSGLWNEVYSIALITVYGLVENELKKEGHSFEHFPDVFGENHREIAAHALALVEHHMLPGQGYEIRHVVEVENLHRYTGKAAAFMGKGKEIVQVWQSLVDILLHRQAANGRRSCIGRLSDTWHRRNLRKDEKSRLAAVYNSLGDALMNNGKLNAAASAHEQSLEIYEAIHGPNKHLDIAASLGSLGSVYQKLGRLDEALEKHEHSLEMKLVIHGHSTPHPAIAMSLNNIGCLYEELGKLDRALEKHEQSLQMYLAIHGHNEPHSDVARSLNNLGNVFKSLGYLDKALEKLEQSFEMYQAIHGPNKPHPDIAKSLNNLGCVYQRLSKLDKALERHEQSLQMYRTIYGYKKPHPDVAMSLNNLGNLYQELGKLSEALEKHEQSLEMNLAIHGPNKSHTAIAMSLNNLGSVFQKLGKLDNALEKHEQSLEMKQNIHGKDKPHPAIAASLENLGNIYQELGKLDKALEKYKQTLKIHRAIHGPYKPHPAIAASLNNLGNVYREQGKLNKALKKLNEGLEMYRAVYGNESIRPAIAASLGNLGSVYEALGRADKAFENHKQSLEMYRVVYGPNKSHPDIANALNNLGSMYVKLGNLEKALEAHELSFEMRRAIHGPNKPHPDIAKSLNNLGSIYQKLRKLDKALGKHKESLEMYQAVYRHIESHPEVATSLNNLGNVYHELGKLDEALENHEKSLKMKLAIHGRDKPHLAIATSLNNLGFVYEALCKQEEALKKHMQSLEMYRAIHGSNKPHSDTAISLWNIGAVYHKQKKQNQAANFLEQSLEMLRIVHARNLWHPDITELLSDLADVYDDQGRRGEAFAIRKRNASRNKTVHGEKRIRTSEN